MALGLALGLTLAVAAAPQPPPAGAQFTSYSLDSIDKSAQCLNGAAAPLLAWVQPPTPQ